MMKKLLLIFAASLAVISCSKEAVPSTEPNNNEGNAVNFSAVMDNQTKANEIPTTAKASVWAYTAGTAVTTAAKVTAKPYTVSTAGTLTTATAMYLPNASYDFYAVGIFSGSEAVPTFTAGSSAQLKNGVDYIVATPQKAKSVNSATLNIPFTFTHAASKLQVTLTAGTGLTLGTITNVKITPPTPSATTIFTLGVATIPQATAVTATATDMDLQSGKTYETIMLPLKTGTTLKLTIDATVTLTGQSAQALTYTADISAPASTGYVGGSNYTYTAEISPNGITFNTVTVTPWTDSSQGIIYPKE